MPVQNLRAYQWIGESLDGGPGNVRTVIWPPTGLVPTTQTFAPNIQTLGFRLDKTVEISSFLATLTSNIPTTALGEMILKNQNPFWVTFTVTANGVTAVLGSLPSQSWNVAIPPMGLYFVPSNVTAFTAITTGLPANGTVPKAPNNMQRCNFDMVVWG